MNIRCYKTPTRHSTTDGNCLYGHVHLLFVNVLLQVWQQVFAAQHEFCSTTPPPHVSGMHTCTAGNLPRLVGSMPLQHMNTLIHET
mgnify:CR=1 FL=1